MKHAYIVISEYEYAGFCSLEQIGFTQATVEIMPDTAHEMARLFALAEHAATTAKNFDVGIYNIAKSYYNNFKSLYRLLKFGKV